MAKQASSLPVHAFSLPAKVGDGNDDDDRVERKVPLGGPVMMRLRLWLWLQTGLAV
jgi:hypothetical protein